MNHEGSRAQSNTKALVQLRGLSVFVCRLVVSIIGCTEDWFGDWDGLNPGHVDKFITEDLKSGRMVEVIDSGEPAIMVCHWTGIYYNGEKVGFNIFKEIVKRLNEKIRSPDVDEAE